MGTRKKGSELVFNLQWRNKPDNGGDKSNVIGMYDTPTTTSNFEMFKSYLLKNSGVAGNDVKVTYLTDNGQEWVIDSQEWFEIALSAFRLKARLGEVIFLKLDKISNGRHQITRKHSNDVETQFDVDSMDNNIVTPPEWFVTYMKQFKRDIVEEITYAVSANSTGNSKEKENILLMKKNKPESSKRNRKQLVLGETSIDKEFLKNLRFDRKLENKLDKLDAKTKKIKEKKQAIINKIENDEHRYVGKFSFIPMDDDYLKISSVKQPVQGESNANPTNNAPNTETVLDTDAEISSGVDRTPLLNASLVNVASVNQNFSGGEVYLHTWEVINSGKLPWSANTELRLTWGSADLVPSVKSLRCPSLKPDEKGSISVRFEIPETPGIYESNWNFYDNNIRFGRTLSLYVTVLTSIRYVTSKIGTSEDSSDIQKHKSSSNFPEQVNRDEPSICVTPDALLKGGDCKVRTRGEIKMLPKGESKPFCLPLPMNAERILYFPNGIDGPKALDIPLNWDKKIESSVQKTEEAKQEIGKNETHPDGEELKAVDATSPANARAIYFYPNGIKDESNSFELSSKKSAEKEATLPANAQAYYFYPNGIGDESKPSEISLKESAEKYATLPPNAKAIYFYPNGIDDESKPFEIPLEESGEKDSTLPANTKAIYFYPNGMEDESKPFEMTLKKSAEKAVSLLNMNISNNLTELDNAQNEVTTGQTNDQNYQFMCCTIAVGEKPAGVNNENTLELSQSQNNFVSEEGFCVVEDAKEATKENILNLSTSVMNLSRKIENLNLAETSNADSDSDWESVWSCGKPKRVDHNLTTDYATGASNKYGISENDLIVDLSTTAKVEEEKPENTEKNDEKKNQGAIGSDLNEDDNNNNGTLDNNNCSGESISEIASEVSSDLSSGYDVVPAFDEKEESSGYIYITIDGNKLPVPKHILRPDFLASVEQASGSIGSDEQKVINTEAETNKNVTEQATTVQILECPATGLNQEIQDKSLMTHCSATGSCFSDTNSGRLFIFPQNHPGYEVVDAAPDANQEEVAALEGPRCYSWTKSVTQYTLADVENADGINPLLRSDPYGPLEQPQSAPEQHQIPTPERATPPSHPTYACAAGSANCSTPEECAQYRFPQCQRPYEFQHVPNYQQTTHHQRRRRPMKTPSAPPQQPKTPQNSPGHGVPVHILPENLVSGAVNVASSAINTARSVINMIVPPKSEPGRWVNGHWVTENPESLRAKNLCILAEMGFWDADLNATLLARYNDDITRVVSELVQ